MSTVAFQPRVSDDDSEGGVLTIRDYVSLIEGGAIGENAPFELIDGVLRPKDRSSAGEDLMHVGHLHVFAVQYLDELRGEISKLGATLRTQSPIESEPFNAPEPDGVIVRGSRFDYAGRHPTPGDVLFVFEVSDHSLRYDLNGKARLYAGFGLACYFVVDVNRRVVHRLTEPDVGRGEYRSRVELGMGGRVELALPRGVLAVGLREFFPQ